MITYRTDTHTLVMMSGTYSIGTRLYTSVDAGDIIGRMDRHITLRSGVPKIIGKLKQRNKIDEKRKNCTNIH